MIRVDPSYMQLRVGEQLLPYFSERHAVRHATPLFPFSLAGLFRRVPRERALNTASAATQA